MSIRKIGVLYGGKSSEREISLKTGSAIADALKKENFDVVLLDPADKNFVKKLLSSKIDFAFIALHGPGGEDGSMQGFLEVNGIPYNGCGVMSSALAMNKIFSKRIFESSGITTPRWEIITKNNLQKLNINLPLVVKPATQGSAIGVTVVRKKDQLVKAVRCALKYDAEVILEEYVEGTEITVPILGGAALVPIQIIPQNDFYDFHSKYSPGGSKHLIPAHLPEKILNEAKKIGLLAHNALGCRAVSRVDMIVDKKDEIYVLEVNTIPGMTATSLYPEAAKYHGITFGKLLKKIIEYSLNEKKKI